MARRISRSSRSRPAHVDLEELERLARERRVDVAGAAHLGEVAHALQQPVGHPRVPRERAAIASAPGVVDLHVEDAGRAADDAREVGRFVELEPVGHAEAVPERRGEQAGARGGADQRERRAGRA